MTATLGSHPIFIRNDRQLATFMRISAQTQSIHLCVTVEDNCVIVEQVYFIDIFLNFAYKSLQSLVTVVNSFYLLQVIIIVVTVYFSGSN
ncbi:hypothetical protein CARUB_v10012779mg [Capsella rubella]|uniref:Uncharacterized protein n=1 Tax=Capsella rubella TaxID=81985 RepID=R0GLY3_9BRAS|nr:hypothetical protein CARUB_v10012779mg [Capsella rubella]